MSGVRVWAVPFDWSCSVLTVEVEAGRDVVTDEEGTVLRAAMSEGAVDFER